MSSPVCVVVVEEGPSAKKLAKGVDDDAAAGGGGGNDTMVGPRLGLRGGVLEEVAVLAVVLVVRLGAGGGGGGRWTAVIMGVLLVDMLLVLLKWIFPEGGAEGRFGMVVLVE